MNGLNKDDVIRMAREAGLPVSDKFDGIGYVWCSDEYPIDEQLERFAALVAAAEREACAKVCENIYEGDEGCGDWPTPEMCAEAIRARGQG